MNSRRWLNGRVGQSDLGWVEVLSRVLGVLLRWLLVIILDIWSN